MIIKHLHQQKTNRSTIDQSLARRTKLIEKHHDKLIEDADTEAFKAMRLMAVVVMAFIVIAAIYSQF